MRARRLASAAALAFAAQLCLAGGASATTFPADAGSTGAIPDATTTGPGAFGSPRNVTFTVPPDTFASGSPTRVAVTFTSTHTFVGDLDVVLKAPNNEQATIFSRTGAVSASTFGDNSNLDGPYTFSDLAPALPTWWEAASGSTADSRAIPGGTYRTSTAGPGSGPSRSLVSDLSNATMNGTWTLIVKDGASGDTGSITAASLELVGAVPANPGFLGDIPDGAGPPLDVLFSVNGLAAMAPSAISVSMAFDPNHTYVGDLEVTLIAPDDSTQATIFSRTGDSAGNNPGDDSNLAGPYNFHDGALGSWWTAAANAVDTSAVVAAGTYRTSAAGGAGSTGANTLINPAFAGVADANGVWKLRFNDRAADDTGSVSAASLRVLSGVDSSAPVAPSLGVNTDPASPSPSGMPKAKGNTELGSTVRLYANGACSGPTPTATGSAAVFNGSVGIPIPIDAEGPGMISATAYDAGGNVSGCSNAISYTRDTIAPAQPTLTQPPSPQNNNFPPLQGNGAEAGSTVKVFGAANCDVGQLFSGTAEQFNGAGIPGFEVLDNTSETYSVHATDQAGNVSDCSNAITYTEDSTALAPTVTATAPASPSNDASPEVKGSGAEAGSTVKIYKAATTADCTPGNEIGTGTAANFNGAIGITAAVNLNATTTLRATITDAATNVSVCSPTSVPYTHDAIAPSAPILSSTDPASPANDDTIAIKGSAEAGSTVKLYDSADCSPPAAFTGTAAELGGAGIAAEVPEDATTSIRATATDAAGNVSACSAPITYVEDSTAPPAPSLTATDPASPANENSPEVKGSAEAGSAVALFTTSDCSGAPGATGTAAALDNPGIAVAVPDDSTTEIRAVATDSVGNPSACSAPISYTESTTLPAPLLDVTPPQTTITSQPKATVKTKGKKAGYAIEFRASEPAAFRCSLDGAPAAPCTSPATGKAKKGSHTFSVFATDTAGNADPSAATATWKVKRKKPRR